MTHEVKKTIGVLAGILVGLGVYLAPIANLPPEGQKCLALCLGAVTWWATSAIHPGYTALALLTCFVLLMDPQNVPRQLIFAIWSSPIIYMVIGGFLIAHAVQDSGLGRRISLHFVKRYVRSYRSVIISCYVLGFLLSLLIPHPWPRSFLIMSVMVYVIQEAHLPQPYAGNVGLAVFAGSVPTSTILLTGDSAMNNLVAQLAGTDISFFQWILYMSPVGVVATVATCLVQLVFFRGPSEFNLDLGEINRQIDTLGTLSHKEKWVSGILAGAIALWMTDALTGIHPGWTALIAVVVMAMPFAGILNGDSWRHVSVNTLLFICAAIAIGNVGGATGMNQWLAKTLMPGHMAGGMFSFIFISMIVCMVIHAFLGSNLAVMGICAPAIISFGQDFGVSPTVSALVVYCSLFLHWLLPIHHMNILVGMGDEGGKFSNSQVLRFGLLQTFVVAATLLFARFWWDVAGLL